MDLKNIIEIFMKRDKILRPILCLENKRLRQTSFRGWRNFVWHFRRCRLGFRIESLNVHFMVRTMSGWEKRGKRPRRTKTSTLGCLATPQGSGKSSCRSFLNFLFGRDGWRPLTPLGPSQMQHEPHLNVLFTLLMHLYLLYRYYKHTFIYFNTFMYSRISWFRQNKVLHIHISIAK